MDNNKYNLIPIENEIIIGRVYKIYNTIDEKVYIGSTTKPLVNRLATHVSDYNRKIKKMDLYTHFSKIGYNNFKMKLLEWKQVDNIQELRSIEQKWINRENPINLLNTRVAIKQKESLTELIYKISQIKLDTINASN